MKQKALTVAMTAVILVLSVPVQAKDKVTYVGGGRYTCTGQSTKCAMIKDNNRRITQEQIESRERGSRYGSERPSSSQYNSQRQNWERGHSYNKGWSR